MSDESDDGAIVLIPEVADMSLDELRKYALERAEIIARATPGDSDSWDDPEEWQDAAVELAHAFVRLCSAANDARSPRRRRRTP